MVDRKRPGQARLGSVYLSGEDFPSYMEFIIMLVALAHDILRVAWLFPAVRKSPRKGTVVLR